MGRGISLRREEVEKVFVQWRGDVFRLRVTAFDNVLMPAEIFAHERRLLDPHTGLQGDEFSFVTGPFDATLYPINEPDELQEPAFFRKDSVDFLLASSSAAEEAWEAIHQEVTDLVEAYNRLDTLVEVETVRVGDDLDSDSESDSDSGSDSLSDSSSDSSSDSESS